MVGPMCNQCVEIDKTIERYRNILRSIRDEATHGTMKLIADLEAQKAALHHRKPTELLALMIIRAVLLAGFVAYVLHVALDDSGLSGDAVVTVATVAAVVLAALVAIEFFGKKLGGPKR
jgi:hypothetical protein